ncbi:MAG: fibronectin type III domain-containing protein [Candidatus Helarchaeota archaeon]|nr:fibronectin type III domain-containing protein [Candidatus Helarchaeota archaeon]
MARKKTQSISLLVVFFLSGFFLSIQFSRLNNSNSLFEVKTSPTTKMVGSERFSYSDEFDSGNLGAEWCWHSDSANSASWDLTTNPSNLRITCPSVAINWETGVTDVPYMYQHLPTGDWEIEIKVNEPRSNDHTNGIIVYKSSNEWIMYANDYDSVGEMNLLTANLGGAPDNYAGGGRGNNHPYLKLKKEGMIYRCFGSDDGQVWNNYGSLTTNISFCEMGIFAHSQRRGTRITINADFDYFYFEKLEEPPKDEIPPEQVTGLTVTEEPVGNCLTLAWNPSITPDFWYYKIYRSTTCGFTPGPGNFIATSMTNAYLDTGLVDDVTYYYRISAVDEGQNEGATSAQVGGTPHDSDPPSQVSGVSVTVIASGTALQLSWTANTEPDLANYIVYRSTTPGFTPGPTNFIASPTTNHYLDTGLVDDVIYYYRVSAMDEVPNEGRSSNEGSGTPHDSEPPSQVLGVSVNVIASGTALELSWTANTEPDLANYKVYRSITSEFTPGPAYLVGMPSSNWFWDSRLIDNITYFYRITAVDEVPNEGTYSDEVSATPQDTVAPAKVTGVIVSVVPSGSALEITWDASVASDLDHYNIYRSRIPGFTPSLSNLIATPPINYYLDTDITENNVHYYRVSAVDEAGNEGIPSSNKYYYPLPVEPPQKVTGVSIIVVPSGNTLVLSWTANTEVDLANYRIYRSTTSGFTPGGGNLIAKPTNNYYLDFGLTDGVTYHYRISAVDEVPNEGTYSDEVSAIPWDTVAPEQVTGLRVSKVYTEGGDAIDIYWAPSPALDVAYYKIYRSTFPSFPLESDYLIGTTCINNFRDRNISVDLTEYRYFYRISAVDETGNEGVASDEPHGEPYIPEVEIVHRSVYQISYIDITYTYFFSNYISSWGELTRYDSQFRVNTEFWILSGENLAFPCAFFPKTHTYELGNLESGIYTFTFETWGCEVRSINFTVEPVPPQKVTGLKVRNEGTGTILNITWNPNPEPDIDHYNIYRSTINNFTTSSSNLISSSITHFYQDIGLTENRTYYYQITAVDHDGNEGPPSDEGANCPIDTLPPGPPTVTFLVVSGDVILIISSTDVDVAYLNIYRSNTSGGPYEFVEAYNFTGDPTLLLVEMPGPSFEDTIPPLSLEDPTINPPVIGFEFNYYYIITAVDENGNEGPPSNEIYIGLPPFYPPEWLEIRDNGNGDLDLRWRDDFRNDPEFIYKYRIYRMNPFTGILEPINTINSTTVNSYIDYGVPNGDWSYFLTIIDIYGDESYLSIPYNVTVKDVIPPGPPTELLCWNREGRITISWNPPAASNYGADVEYYGIYILNDPVIDVTGLIPNVTVFGRENTHCTFNISTSTYYLYVNAFDENGLAGAPASVIVDLEPPHLSILPDWTSAMPDPAPNKEVEITIRAYDRGGIDGAYIIYQVNNGLTHILRMELIKNLPNNSNIYRGIIPGQPAGAVVNFTIIVVDKYGHSMTSSYYSYSVVEKEPKFVKFPWWVVIIIIFFGAIATSSYVVITIFQNSRKEKRIKSLLEKVIREPMSLNFGNIESLTSHANEPRVIISNPFEPYNESPNFQYQDFAGHWEGFHLILLLMIFNSLLKAFPTLDRLFAGENKLMYVMELNSISHKEQISLFKSLINRNLETEIRLQLNNQMVELNTVEMNESWEQVLPKLNYCFDLSQILSDREFLTDLFLLTVLIKNSLK